MLRHLISPELPACLLIRYCMVIWPLSCKSSTECVIATVLQLTAYPQIVWRYPHDGKLHRHPSAVWQKSSILIIKRIILYKHTLNFKHQFNDINHIFTIINMISAINLSIINHLTLRQVTSMLTVASIHLARERPLDALRSAKDCWPSTVGHPNPRGNASRRSLSYGSCVLRIPFWKCDYQ